MATEQGGMQPDAARLAWRRLEPYHAIIYFAPEARQAYKEIGLKGYWMGYFASRSAPIGPVPASVVTATFFNFHPSMVERALPDAWRFASPEQVLEARYASADAALRRLLGQDIASAGMQEAAIIARRAVEACSVAGRALFAAYTELPWPSEPHMVLWHAATLLREYRGDGHVVSLLAEGLDGCEAHVTLAGTGVVNREQLQPARGWSDEEWLAAQKRLYARGLLGEDGLLTEEGVAVRQAVEERTDLLALPPWQYLGSERMTRLLELVYPFSERIVEEGGIPIPNPMGLTWP